MRFFSISKKQTFNFAKKIAKKLNGGEVFGLIGDLGAGKTVFTKGLAKGLAIKKNITSPTFVLMRLYPVKHHKIKKLIHIDAYRVKTNKNLIAIGADEYFGQPDTVTIVEWADKIKKVLPKKTRFITINHKDQARIIKY